jgi:hypothetical protein
VYICAVWYTDMTRGARQMWCRADVVQASVQCGAGREWWMAWCRTRSRVWCRANVVQASVVRVVQGECGAGECGLVWCRARVVQNESRWCRASVVQGGVRAGAVQWCGGSACEFGSVWSSILNKPNA